MVFYNLDLYHLEKAAGHMIIEVNQGLVPLIVGWVTAWNFRFPNHFRAAPSIGNRLQHLDGQGRAHCDRPTQLCDTSHSRADKLPEQYCACASQPVKSMNVAKFYTVWRTADIIKGDCYQIKTDFKITPVKSGLNTVGLPIKTGTCSE